MNFLKVQMNIFLIKDNLLYKVNKLKLKKI